MKLLHLVSEVTLPIITAAIDIWRDGYITSLDLEYFIKNIFNAAAEHVERWESTCSNVAALPADSLLPLALHLFLSLPPGININLNPKAWSDLSCSYTTLHLTPHQRRVFLLEYRPTCHVLGKYRTSPPLISYVTSASVSDKQFSVRHFNELLPGYSPPNYQETGEAVTLKSSVSSEHLTLSDNACLERAAISKRRSPAQRQTRVKQSWKSP